MADMIPFGEEWTAAETRILAGHLDVFRELAKRLDVDLGVVIQLRLLGAVYELTEVQRKPMKLLVPKEPEEEWKSNG